MTINVSTVLATELRLRSSVSELENACAEKGNEETVVFDFLGVTFASRSFMDEFYNKLLLHDNIRAIHMSCDLEEVLNAVKHTQRPITTNKLPYVHIEETETTADLCASLERLSFI